MKNKSSLFIATSSFAINDRYISKIIKKKNILVKLNPKKRKLSESEIVAYAKKFTHIIAGTENYSEFVLEKLENLKYIHRLGSGEDNINLKVLNKKNIIFSKSKITPEKAVAELIIGYVLCILRKIHEQNSDMKKNIWKKKMGNLLYGKTFGVIGYGKVGKYLSKLIRSFGAKLIVAENKKIKNFEKKSLNYLVSKSDIISVNTSYEKKKILNKEILKKTKKKLILINASRSELIDNDYLFKMLKKNKNLEVALDVYDIEPYKGKFNKLSNVLLTPHIGGYAKEIRLLMEREAIKKINSKL